MSERRPAFPDDPDYTPPYPCCICGKEFKSRHALATHPHPKEDRSGGQ